MMAEKTKIRCAIYTRKSVDDGTLDSQEFSSLDAQREAGEAYILSQKANGWECLPEHYDDGGFSGGNINRPALTRLLADIKAGKIDMVVVYKLDRLSRSLTDFSDLQEIFEQYHVSFCSVTQEINTSTPAGRMMLNILMSFGQYERELVAERTRDKYIASRKRGMWMGGFVPYGYRSENKKIFPDPLEAPVVKRMFQRFVETQSPKLIAHELNQDGLTSRKKKAWINTYVARILKNPVYVGDVEYKGEIFKGEHEAIVSRQTWNRVQEIIKSNCPYERSGGITSLRTFRRYYGNHGSPERNFTMRALRMRDESCILHKREKTLLLLLLQYGLSSVRKTLSGRKNRFKYHRGCSKRADSQDFFLNVFSGDDFQSHRNHRGGITTDFPRRILAGMLQPGIQPGTESALFRTV